MSFIHCAAIVTASFYIALRTIAEESAGDLLCEYQGGRGIGLMQKLRAYALQDQGSNIIEANLHLGHAIDLRGHRLPVDILRLLKVPALRLMTTNPEKINAVRESGVEIIERMSADVPASAYLRGLSCDQAGSTWASVVSGAEPDVATPARSKDDIGLTIPRQVNEKP